MLVSVLCQSSYSFVVEAKKRGRINTTVHLVAHLKMGLFGPFENFCQARVCRIKLKDGAVGRSSRYL